MITNFKIFEQVTLNLLYMDLSTMKQYIIEHPEYIDKRYSFEGNNTLLHNYIFDQGVVEFLVEHGANLNIQNDDGDTPILKLLYFDEGYEELHEDLIFNIITILITDSDLTIHNNDDKFTFFDKLSEYENLNKRVLSKYTEIYKIYKIYKMKLKGKDFNL